MIATLRDMTFTAKGGVILSLNLEADFREEFDRLQEKKLDVTIKEHRDKRSGEANRYMWRLCELIANSQGITKEEVYRGTISKVGIFTILTMKEEALRLFTREWCAKGTGWFIEVADTHGDMVDAFAYYGTSTYDTKEMSRVIESLIQDAKALGIPTETPAELALLLNN